MSALLSCMERSHIAPPSRKSVRVVRSRYKREVSKSCIYTISPFVVARTMDWRHLKQILIINVATEQWYRKPASQGSLISFLYKEPRSERQLWMFAEKNGLLQHHNQLLYLINKLREDGILVICYENGID